MGGEEIAPPLSVGVVLRERYRVERMLDAAQTRRRYLIADPTSGRVLVLHQYPAEWSDPDGAAEIGAWFAAAATRWANLSHPCIAPVRDHWSVLDDEGGALYLVVDQVPGLSLAEELLEAGGRLRVQQALDWAIAIGELLVYLHGQSLTFGQVRPARFVLDPRHDAPVLVEFGFGQALSPTAGDHWGYVPFEQVIGRTEPRSDLYALGVLLHALLGGADPDHALARLRRQGLDAQRARHALFPAKSWAALSLPPAITAVLTRATAFGVQDRYPSAAAMLEALRAARGPVVEVESVGTEREPETMAPWTQLGFDRVAWFALPAATRNQKLLQLAAKG
jgi:serine/threonine-protein kinase